MGAEIVFDFYLHVPFCLFVEHQVIVSVNDINDGAPMFVRDVYGPYSVVEEVSNSYIDSFQATDTDQGLAGTVTYSVIGQYSSKYGVLRPATEMVQP